jgi:hypothetical protein
MSNRISSILVIGAGALAIILTAVALAGAPPTLARVADLPPRPTAAPTATPLPDNDTDNGDVTPQGATITLMVENPPPQAWTVVQWQDAFGEWRDVTGWQGRLDDGAGDAKIWWVAAKDFDTGPFRWQVYEQDGGELAASSDAFMLPAEAGAVVVVEVTAASTP